MKNITVSTNAEATEVCVMLPTDVAGNLLALLGTVADMTDSEGLDRLFDSLIAAGVEPVGTVVVEENPMHEDYPEDEPSHNVVVED